MFSLLFSILLVLVQAVLCNELDCEHPGTRPEALAARVTMPTLELAPSRRYTLADLGQAAIGLAFSGVVEIGEGPLAAPPLPAVAC